MIVVLCICLALLAVPSLELDFEDSTLISPCPKVFMYELSKSEPGRWYGVINLTTDKTLHPVWVNILFDLKVDILRNWLGNVHTNDNRNFKIENAFKQIDPEQAVLLRFFVQYRKQNNKIPKLMAIRLNGREICTADKPDVIIQRFKEPIDDPSTKAPGPVLMKPDDPFFSGRPLDRFIDIAGIKVLHSPRSTNSRGVDGQPLCGKVVSNTSVSNGESPETNWPWQIALYQTEDVSPKYICGGTLVTAQHVITAAHCVTSKSSEDVIDRQTLAVFLGKQNLWKSVDGEQVKYIKKIIVHPDYDPSTYSRDVAILELNRPVMYSDRVRPACLWPKKEIHLKSVIGKKGLLLSWSFDDKDKIISDITQEEMPVVSQAMCIKSHKKFVRFTSEYTYCAGNRDETAPCASAGSGMVFNVGSTWYLRGLASLAVPGHSKKRCDTSHYVIFTDLAKFLPWISSNVFDL